MPRGVTLPPTRWETASPTTRRTKKTKTTVTTRSKVTKKAASFSVSRAERKRGVRVMDKIRKPHKFEKSGAGKSKKSTAGASIDPEETNRRNISQIRGHFNEDPNTLIPRDWYPLAFDQSGKATRLAMLKWPVGLLEKMNKLAEVCVDILDHHSDLTEAIVTNAKARVGNDAEANVSKCISTEDVERAITDKSTMLSLFKK